MIKTSMLALAILASAAFTSSASAQNAHFIKNPVATLDTKTGDYCVSFKEAGLGNGPVTYTITAEKAGFTPLSFRSTRAFTGSRKARSVT